MELVAFSKAWFEVGTKELDVVDVEDSASDRLGGDVIAEPGDVLADAVVGDGLLVLVGCVSEGGGLLDESVV